MEAFFSFLLSSLLFDLFSFPSLKLYWKLPTGKYQVFIMIFFINGYMYLWVIVDCYELLCVVLGCCGSLWVILRSLF